MFYVTVAPWRWWVFCWRRGDICGIFRNKEGVRPGRWGFYILGLEIGSRQAGDRVGVFLRRIGLWPW